MALGKGKYDADVTKLRHEFQADGVVLIVANGLKGNGFAIQADTAFMHKLPALLRAAADSFEKDVANVNEANSRDALTFEPPYPPRN